MTHSFLLASNLFYPCRSCCLVQPCPVSQIGVRSQAPPCSQSCTVERHLAQWSGAQPKCHGSSVWTQLTAVSVILQSFCIPEKIDTFGPPHKARLHLKWSSVICLLGLLWGVCVEVSCVLISAFLEGDESCFILPSALLSCA